MKLLIVDDEAKTRVGLKKQFDWSSIGITEIEMAEDGEDGLRVACLFRPDIVLTDVRMPRMDGIEMTRRLREYLPGCQVIFLSGYSDKAYLKSAIQLSAVDYVEKPVEFEELENAVRQAIRSARQVREIGLDIPERALVTSWFEHSSNQIPISFTYDEVGIRLGPEEFYLPLAFRLAPYKQTLSPSSINQLIKCLFREKNLTALIGWNEPEHLYVVICGSPLSSQEHTTLISETMDRLTKEIESSWQFLIGAGVRVKGVANVPQSAQEALHSLSEAFYGGYGQAVFPVAIFPSSIQVSDEEVSIEFLQALRKNDSEAATQSIDRLVERLTTKPHLPIKETKHKFFLLFVQLMKAFEERNALMFEITDNHFVWEELSSLWTLNEVKSLLIEAVNAYFHSLNHHTNKNLIVQQMITFIRTHYSNPELSIQLISDHVHLSYIYTCQIFKQETGRTIIQMLTETRIEAAKELMKNKQIKMTEIARSVGYDDASYFTKTFKKTTGKTPSEYREGFFV